MNYTEDCRFENVLMISNRENGELTMKLNNYYCMYISQRFNTHSRSEGLTLPILLYVCIS